MKAVRSILTALVLLGISGCLHTQPPVPEEVPPDFRVDYTAGPVHEGAAPHRFIHIRPMPGEAPAYELVEGLRGKFYDGPGGRPVRKEVIKQKRALSRADALSLYRTIEQKRFWRLKALYRTEDVIDGGYEELKIRAGGRERTVSLVNADHERFQRIVDKLEALVASHTE